MEKVIKGWVIVDSAGKIYSGIASTKKVMLDSAIKSMIKKQVWKKEAGNSGNWSGELTMVVPRTFRDVWPKHYRMGYRFVRAQATITTEA